ncbi:glycosyltransferase family 4 protein [uncultured Psychromonas sp.]|uniref:glycosyltransferase family 4 protein n=1 Tax=uncultured Psychromonas sp. TaxID=173974 RepID=UPI002614FF48|nr:glycosyltransferase family 4 protein [uncultured Psychromonas sp.]
MILNVCLVAHFAYGAINGGSNGSIGGVERQTSLMAQWLASKGHKVSLLTWSEGSNEDEVINGVKIIKICRKDAGLPGVRFFTPRWTGLISAMKRANADVYYQNCGEYVTGQVAMWCKVNNKKFLYSLASDADAEVSLPVMRKWRERVLYRYGLKNANQILTQTAQQRALLKNGFSLDSAVMPMPCPDKSAGKSAQFSDETFTVLWAARIHVCKRLELLLEVASELPEVNFVVGGSSAIEDEYFQMLFNKMSQLKNVSYLGMVAREEMPALYRASSLFCCTSEYEGYPNTFLEAWSHSLPIVSTFDPDNLIKNKNLGISAHSKSELIDAIKVFHDDPELWKEHSFNARDYYVNNHTVDEVMKRFEILFTQLSTQLSEAG